MVASAFAFMLLLGFMNVTPSVLVATRIDVTYELAFAPWVTTALTGRTVSKSNCSHEFCRMYSAFAASHIPPEFRAKLA